MPERQAYELGNAKHPFRVRLEHNLLADLRAEAKRQDKTIAKLITDVLTDYLYS